MIFTPSSLAFYILYYFFMEYRLIFICIANSSCSNGIYISRDMKVAKNIHDLEKRSWQLGGRTSDGITNTVKVILVTIQLYQTQ